MKKIILSATVAMLLASPAFAQSYSGEYGTGNVINQPALEHGGPAWQGEFQGGFHAGGGFQTSLQGGPYAYEPPRATSHKQYVGRDPDPNVRLELRRDWTHD
jgi:hypothetical protein